VHEDVHPGVPAELLQDLLDAGLAGEVEVHAFQRPGVDGQTVPGLALGAGGVDAAFGRLPGPAPFRRFLQAGEPVLGHGVGGIQHRRDAHLPGFQLDVAMFFRRVGLGQVLRGRQRRGAPVADLGLEVVGVLLQRLVVFGQRVVVAGILIGLGGLVQVAAGQGQDQAEGQGHGSGAGREGHGKFLRDSHGCSRGVERASASAAGFQKNVNNKLYINTDPEKGPRQCPAEFPGLKYH